MWREKKARGAWRCHSPMSSFSPSWGSIQWRVRSKRARVLGAAQDTRGGWHTPVNGAGEDHVGL